MVIIINVYKKPLDCISTPKKACQLLLSPLSVLLPYLGQN